MPLYTIEVLRRPDRKSGEGGIMGREQHQFANLGEALQCAREMYRLHEASSVGFRILDAADNVVHEWKR